MHLQHLALAATLSTLFGASTAIPPKLSVLPREPDAFIGLASAVATDSAASAAANPPAAIAQGPGSSTYWISDIPRRGQAAFGDPNYKVYRNVKTDCGAVGDGVTDDTAALNQCLASGGRCGQGCDSTTITPALLYFPPGTYMVSKALQMYYYSHLVGDALNLPVIKALPNFEGMAVLDADPYEHGTGEAKNWFTNQNNFFRQVRNFVIDLTGLPADRGAGIHWQVAQATSLQNIRFEMVRDQSPANKQVGVFMDNGSGGFMADLTFNGGQFGMFVGNQQFTTRNLTFNGCSTAIYMNWNWLWTFQDVKISNCLVGIDTANNPSNQTVGSVILVDSVIQATVAGINNSFTGIPPTGGTLVIDNVDFTGSPIAVQDYAGETLLPGGSVVQSWTRGQTYTGAAGARDAGMLNPSPFKPESLLANGKLFSRSKPQYADYPASAFVSVKSAGAKGDGRTDDSDVIQNAMNSLQDGQILYFDHGAYIITKTINVPKNIKITGEVWPLIMASGPFFGDQNNPQPVFKVGESGDVGAAELSELMFETAGPAPGAIMIQWNSAAATQGANGMWDVNVRIGGSAGTQLQYEQCAKKPDVPHGPDPNCIGAHTMLHLTKTSSVYIENCWYWVADHELDSPAKPAQIDIYSGRGVFIESQGPVWMYGSASEHSVLYNYQLKGAQNIFMGSIQTETPYFQSNPPAPAPFNLQADVDPPFNDYPDNADKKAWGVRMVDSSNVLVYGAGLYSFFENYAQLCVPENNCQNRMVSIEGNVSNLNFFGLSTKASVSMVSTAGGYVLGGPNSGTSNAVSSLSVLDADNRSNFCATLAVWRTG